MCSDSAVRPVITVACGVYDRTAGLFDGSVRAEGVDLNMIGMLPGELFRRQARHAEFDASEFSLATLMILASRGDDRFVGIPVYPARRFRHEHVWINSQCAIESPSDLKGRRVGVQEFIQTASVWIRGFLSDDYGVPQDSVEWFVGGYNAPESAYEHRIPLQLRTSTVVHQIPDDRCLNDLLVSGEIDAIFPGRPRAIQQADPRVRPLFTNFAEVEADYFARTHIFPIMHVVIIKREIYERAPWMAASIYRAFEEAKWQAFDRLRNYPGPLYSSLPWQSKHLSDTELLLGSDYWSYGVRGNRHVLERLAHYLWEQGLLAHPIGAVEALFAPETVNLEWRPQSAGGG